MTSNALMRTREATRSRPLSSMEKMFWHADQGHPNHFCMVGEVRGKTRIDDWRRALKTVIAQSPLARSRIHANPDGNPILWLGEADAVVLKVIHGDAGDWRAAVSDQLVERFDTANGPLVRPTLLFEEDLATIVLAAHHSIADGMGLTFLLRDILFAMGGEPVARSSESRSAESLVAAAYDALPPATPGEAPPPVPFRIFDQTRPVIASASLDAATTERLRHRARAEGTTVHCVLAAALAVARTNLGPEEGAAPSRILSPLDLRKRMLGSTEHLGLCLVGALTQEDHACDLWVSARTMADTLAPFKTPLGLLAVLGAVQAMEPHFTSVEQTREILACAFGCDILLTNLGALDFPETYGALRLEAVWGPAVMMGCAGEQTVGVSTHAGRLNLLHTSYAPIEDLLPETVRMLVDALGNADTERAV